MLGPWFLTWIKFLSMSAPPAISSGRPGARVRHQQMPTFSGPDRGFPPRRARYAGATPDFGRPRRMNTAIAFAAVRASRLKRVTSSFRVQIAMTLAGLGVVLAAALSVVLGEMLAERSERDEGVTLHTVAKNAATMLSDGLALRLRQVEILAVSPTLWSEGLGAERVVQTIGRVQALDPHDAWIGVVDRDGVVRAASGKLLIGVDVSARPWYIKGREGSHVGDVHAAKLLAELLPKAGDGGPQRFVDFAAPIRRNGETIGVVGLHGSWEWTRSVVESLLPSDARERGIQVFVFDRGGKLIFSPDGHPERSAQTLGTLTRPIAPADHRLAAVVAWAEEAEFLTSTVAVKAKNPTTDLGWTVVAREPAAVALSAAHDGTRHALICGVVAAAVACLLGWWLADRLAKPLRQMAAAAKQVEAGVDGARIPALDSSSEVAQLSRALAGMTERLVASNLALEQRVRQRTAELEAANAALGEQARHDPLTGLYNRRGFDERFADALASTLRRREPLSVLLFDIDHFKRINDTHGHAVGDVTLRSIAMLLGERLRQTDVIARFGGEEFIVLLHDTDAQEALAVADSVIAIVAGTSFPVVDHVTVSCGIAQLRPASDDGDALVQRADAALYRAKHAGRNRSCAGDDGSESRFGEIEDLRRTTSG